MRIPDFLQQYTASSSRLNIAYQTDILDHFDAFLRQICPNAKLLLITQPQYREYVESKLIHNLQSQGIETAYCLCNEQPGMPYAKQIEDSLSQDALNHIDALVSFGDNALFHAVRTHATRLNRPCAAILDDFADAHALEPIGNEIPFPCGLFFDLNAIANRYKGKLSDPIHRLEIEVYSMTADLFAFNAFNDKFDNILFDILREAIPPCALLKSPCNEDTLAQICESYAWLSIAHRIIHKKSKTSLEIVYEYAKNSTENLTLSPLRCARLLAQLFDAALEIESLEIDPDACAARQPPKEILSRTLRQILLDDGVPFSWLKIADENFEDRITLKNELNSILLNWDEFSTNLRTITDVLRAICTDAPDDADCDPALKTLWIHAGRFAPKHSFLKLFNDLGLIEPSLYL